ncbi:glycosyltransferase [Rhodohalobacter sp. 614A]|uniref:glycosyltransferase n=1 Tax=Rhodohalobacter sp. 614A TaxID=2908649 RepID=UPI001F3A6C3C|nr:glycosyltransferase [Rhodohalobacter sp. 614A]
MVKRSFGMDIVPVGMNIPQRTEEEQLQFFEQCIDCYSEAVKRTGEIKHYYNIAGTTVCFVFAGASLIPLLTPALSHLRLPAKSEAEATIYIWDSESTGVDMAAPPCENTHFTDRGDIWGFNSERIKTAFHWSEFSVNVMDMDSNKAVYWVKNPDHLPYWATSSPFRTIFHWWMEKNGCQLMHAAAVGTDDGAVLITAKGGAGKSTTALSSLVDGMYYLSDDYLIVKKDPVPKVFTLYSTAKIGVNDKHRFTELEGYKAEHLEQDQEKDVIYLYPAFKGQIKNELPIKSILMPSIQKDQAETTFSSISFWQIYRAMSFTTMSQLPGVGIHTHDYFKELCEAVPCMTLNLGSDIEKVPVALRNHLKNPEYKYSAAKTGIHQKDDIPLVSVIIPVHNGEKFIEEAVENVLSQDYPAVEIIIVNDGSTDNSDFIIRNLKTDVRYFSRQNSGPSSARNTGIKDASGKYIAFLDVDDLWPENNLSYLVELLEENEDLHVVRGYAQLFRDAKAGGKEYLGNPKESYEFYIGAGLYRADVFSKVGLFDLGLLFGEDTDWYNRAREEHIPIKWLDEVTLFVRRHGENMTEGKTLAELNRLRTVKRAIDRHRSYKDK